MSISRCSSAQEILRTQDTVAALRRTGWAVDVLAPRVTPMLTAALGSDAGLYTVPRLPGRRIAMFVKGFALVSRRDYCVLHGFDEGAGMARAIARAVFRRVAYIAEIHHPETVGDATLEGASAVILSDESALAGFRKPPPMARVSILPDPHAELADNAFTAAEYSEAIGGIYGYVLSTPCERRRR